MGTGGRVDTGPRSGPWGGSSDGSPALQVAPCWLGVPGFRWRASGMCPQGNTSGLSKGARGPQEAGWQAHQSPVSVRPRNAGILQMTLGERPPGRWVHMRGGGAGSLAGGRRGLVLPRLGLGGGVPGQQQLLDGAVRRALRGEAVFLEEGKGGWPRLTGRGRRGAGRSPGTGTGGLARDKCRLRCARTLTARDSHSSPTGPLPALLNLVNCAWYCTVARKPSSPTSVMRFPGGRGRQPTHHLL